VTIIESGNAQGVRLRPTVVFTGKYLQEQWFPAQFPDWGYDTTKNGWASNAVCLKWLRETFLPETKPEKSTDWRILIVDNFAGHISVQFRFMALFHRVQVMYLPPHSSHITQPFDVGVFSPLKSAFRRLARKFTGIRSNNAIGKQRFLQIYKKAGDEAITRENIISGFRGAGIWPIDVEKPLSKIITTSEPPGQNPVPATPQHQRVISTDMPYTPQNKMQLLNQLKDIKSRQDGYERDLRRLGIKTANKLDQLIAQNTIEKQKTAHLELEIESLKPQKQRKVVWAPQARYPTAEEIHESKEAKLERLRKKRKRDYESAKSRKRNDTIVIPDESTS
jgi:4-hydroxybenzoate polyprenyltransferase